MNKDQTLADYIEYLWTKGFKLSDEQVYFIYFGKQSTNASDPLVQIAIETTLRVQRSFDGSFYISLLELLQENNITTITAAKRLFYQKDIK